MRSTQCFHLAQMISSPHHQILQKSASVHANVHNHFNLERHLIDRQGAVRANALVSKDAELAGRDPPFNVPIKGHVSGLGKIKHREFAQAIGEMIDATTSRAG